MNAKITLSFVDSYAIADAAAVVLYHERPRQGAEGRRGSAYIRSSGVNALRFLWKTGDWDIRMMVAARVHVWLHGNARRGVAAVERQQRRATR